MEIFGESEEDLGGDRRRLREEDSGEVDRETGGDETGEEEEEEEVNVNLTNIGEWIESIYTYFYDQF
jgi:hypothetical protein